MRTIFSFFRFTKSLTKHKSLENHMEMLEHDSYLNYCNINKKLRTVLVINAISTLTALSLIFLNLTIDNLTYQAKSLLFSGCLLLLSGLHVIGSFLLVRRNLYLKINHLIYASLSYDTNQSQHYSWEDQYQPGVSEQTIRKTHHWIKDGESKIQNNKQLFGAISFVLLLSGAITLLNVNYNSLKFDIQTVENLFIQ